MGQEDIEMVKIVREFSGYKNAEAIKLATVFPQIIVAVIWQISKDKQRKSERIVKKLESEKSKTVESHQKRRRKEGKFSEVFRNLQNFHILQQPTSSLKPPHSFYFLTSTLDSSALNLPSKNQTSSPSNLVPNSTAKTSSTCHSAPHVFQTDFEKNCKSKSAQTTNSFHK
jgi:hypothetical protein